MVGGGGLPTTRPDQGGTPIQFWPEGTPIQSRPEDTWGTPCQPDGSTPPLPGRMGVPPIRKNGGTTQSPPQPRQLDGVPPPLEVWTNKQTENSTFPYPSDVGGN